MGISMSESDEMRRLQFLHQQPHYIVAITENRPILQLKQVSNEAGPRQLRVPQPSKVRCSPQEPAMEGPTKQLRENQFQLFDAETVTEMQVIQKPIERQRSNKLTSQSKENYEEDDLVKWSKSQLRESKDNRNISSALRARKVKIVKN